MYLVRLMAAALTLTTLGHDINITFLYPPEKYSIKLVKVKLFFYSYIYFHGHIFEATFTKYFIKL